MGKGGFALRLRMKRMLLAVLAVAAGPLHWSEGHAALAALAGVALYYVVLWLFRKRIEHTIQFTITKI